MARVTFSDSLDVSSPADRFVIHTRHESEARPLLLLERISHRFGALVALDEASLQVSERSVHALVGENGAGKTTLMRIVFGLLSPDEGVIRWRGTPLITRSPSQALAAGIGMVHQHFTLVPGMTVAENVALGRHGLFDPKSAAKHVREVGARVGLDIDPWARVDTLSVSEQQRCEIIKAIARNVSLLILDEPTSMLAPAEARELLAWMRQFADAGNAIVLITHKLRDALAVADDVTVMHRGRTVLSTRANQVSEPVLASAMLGEPANGSHESLSALPRVLHYTGSPQATEQLASSCLATSRCVDDPTLAQPIMALFNVTWRDMRGIVQIRNLNMNVHAGEIVGIASVEGAGPHALMSLLAGRMKPWRGSVRTPGDVGFVPEDRNRDALLSDAPLYENVALRGAGARRGRLSWPEFRARTTALMTHFNVHAAGPDAVACTLSGGNQQRFVLSRELSGSPPALVVDNPSHGLDFKAAADIHDALRAARNGGTAIAIYSSDLDELLMLSDRICVMHDGHVTVITPDRDSVGRAMLGSTSPVEGPLEAAQ